MSLRTIGYSPEDCQVECKVSFFWFPNSSCQNGFGTAGLLRGGLPWKTHTHIVLLNMYQWEVAASSWVVELRWTTGFRYEATNHIATRF